MFFRIIPVIWVDAPFGNQADGSISLAGIKNPLSVLYSGEPSGMKWNPITEGI
jgi:hypothetical protein